MQKLKRKELAEKRERIVDQLLAHGWKPNKQYFASGRGHGNKPDEHGKGGYYGYYYLISGDSEMALTIKPQALLAHQASRSYAKVLSMLIKEVEVNEIGIRAGKLIICH